MKRCYDCNLQLPYSAFSEDQSQPDGHHILCRSCQKVRRDRPGAKVRTSRTVSNSTVKMKYGITVEQYKKMLGAQDSQCAICNVRTAGGNSSRFKVDHCHDSGLIRGLLCDDCNRRTPSLDVLKTWAAYDVDPPAFRIIGPRHFVGSKGSNNLVSAEYLLLLDEQDDCCAVCYSINPGLAKFSVDHCHDTGFIRGLLCNACNRIMPSSVLLAKMIAYDRDPPAVRAIGRVFV